MAAHYEPGYYECQITDQGFDVSPEKKRPYFWLRFTPEDGEYERQVNLWLSEKTVDRVIQRLRDMGWEGDSFRDLEPGGHSFAGVTVRLRCEHNDKGYEDWEFPLPEGSKPQNKEGVARKLDALFGKSLKGKPGGRPKPKSDEYSEPVEQAASVADDEDDIPF